MKVVYNNTSNTHNLNNKILPFSSAQKFVLCMLSIHRHEILAHNTSKVCNLAFLSSYMFLQIIKFRYHELFPSINLTINLATHHAKLPITPHNYFNPRKFCYSHFLKISIQFPFPFLMFFFLVVLAMVLILGLEMEDQDQTININRRR